MTELPELMTLAEVAALVRVEPRTLANWRSARRPGLPVGFRPAGSRAVLFRRADVLRWVDAEFSAAARERAGGGSAA